MSLPVLEDPPERYHEDKVDVDRLHKSPPKMFRDSSTQKYDPLPIDYGPSESERGRIKEAHLEENQRLTQIAFLTEALRESQ